MSAQILEEAIIAVCKATDGRGLKVMLCNPMDPDDVRRRLLLMVHWLNEGNVWLDFDAEEAAARNVALLANLLHEHLKHRRELRESTSACNPQT